MDKMNGAHADQGGNARTQSVPTGATKETNRTSQTHSSPYRPRSLGGMSPQTSRPTSPAESERLLTQQPHGDGTPARLPGAKKTQSLSAASNETRAVTRQKSEPSTSMTEGAKKTTARQPEETRSSEKREKPVILSDNLRLLGLNLILLDVPRGNHCWEHVLRAEVPEKFIRSDNIRNLLLTYLTTSRQVEPSLADLRVHNLFRELKLDDLPSFNELAPVLALYLDKPVVIVNLEAPQQEEEATQDHCFYCVRPGESNLTITESIPTGMERAVKFGWIMSENHYLCLAEEEDQGSLSTCAVCCEPFAYPRAVHATPCGHLFDRQCLITLIRNDCQSRSQQQYYKCPTCRSNTDYFRCREGTRCNEDGVYLTETEKDMHDNECDYPRYLSATIIEAFASAGLCSASWHTGRSSHQVELAKVLLNDFTAKYYGQRTVPRCICAQDIANLLWAVATLVDNDLLEWTPKLKEAVATLWPLVYFHRLHFDAQGIVNLLRAIAKLVDNGLERIQEFTEDAMGALFALLSKVSIQKDHFNARNIANLLWDVATLVDNGLSSTLVLKEVVAKLLFQLSIRKDHFDHQQIVSLLWAIAKLVDNGLGPPEETVAALLSQVTIRKDHFDHQQIVSLLWAIAKLVDNGLGPPEETVAALLSQVTIREVDFNAQGITSLLWAMAKLLNNGWEQTQVLKVAVTALLPRVRILQYHFKAQDIANLLWATAMMGELIESPEVFITVLVEDRVLNHKLTNSFSSYQHQVMSYQHQLNALWGLLAVSARQSLCPLGASVVEALKRPMRALFDELKKGNLYDRNGTSIMAMAASWLNLTCEAIPSYNSTTSPIHSHLYSQLKQNFPAEEIRQGVSLDHLPPVDILFPKRRLVIEVLGPQHCIGGDHQTRNGKTILKVALYQNMGYRVIGVPVNKLNEKNGHEELIRQLDYIFNLRGSDSPPLAALNHLPNETKVE